MGEPDAVDPHQVGRPVSGAAISDGAGAVAPLRPAQKPAAQDVHGLCPADAGLSAPVAAGPGFGGGRCWQVRQAGVSAFLSGYVQTHCCRRQTAQGRIPLPASAAATARSDGAAQGRRSPSAQSGGGSGRPRHPMDHLPRHRLRRQCHHRAAGVRRGSLVRRWQAPGSHALGWVKDLGEHPKPCTLLCTGTGAEPL